MSARTTGVPRSDGTPVIFARIFVSGKVQGVYYRDRCRCQSIVVLSLYLSSFLFCRAWLLSALRPQLCEEGYDARHHWAGMELGRRPSRGAL